MVFSIKKMDHNLKLCFFKCFISYYEGRSFSVFYSIFIFYVCIHVVLTIHNTPNHCCIFQPWLWTRYIFQNLVGIYIRSPNIRNSLLFYKLSSLPQLGQSATFFTMHFFFFKDDGFIVATTTYL
jgi:hypothetical protein